MIKRDTEFKSEPMIVVSSNQLIQFAITICMIKYFYYIDINNQQDAKTFSFIDIFTSALHVSGDKFAHSQEHFLSVYTVFGTMQRQCSRTMLRLKFNSSISTVAPVSSSVGALYQKLYTQSKSAPEDGRVSRPKHVGLI